MPIDECLRKHVAEQSTCYRAKALQFHSSTDVVRWLAAKPHAFNAPFLTVWIWKTPTRILA